MISCKGAHFPQDIILMGVRWYLAWRRSDHDLHCSPNAIPWLPCPLEKGHLKNRWLFDDLWAMTRGQPYAEG
jgi:hypothetical protein